MQIGSLLLTDIGSTRFETRQGLRVRGDVFGRTLQIASHELNLRRHYRLDGHVAAFDRSLPGQISAEREETCEQH